MTFTKYYALIINILLDLTKYKRAFKIKSNFIKSKLLFNNELTSNSELVNKFINSRIVAITK